MLDHIQGQEKQSVFRVDNFTAPSILTKFSARFKGETLCQWRGSEISRSSKYTHQNFTGQKYMLSFEGVTLQLKETATVLRSWDVILRGPAPFWCMMHVYVLVIIHILKRHYFLTHSRTTKITCLAKRLLL